MELFRQELAQSKASLDFEENFVKSIVFMIVETGWSIEYVMNLGVNQFYEVSKGIVEIYKTKAKAYEVDKM